MILYAAILALVLQTTPGQATPQAEISGIVFNGSNGEPLSDVRVSLARTDMSLGPFAQLAGSDTATISIDLLRAMNAALQARSPDAEVPPESAAMASALKALPLGDIMEIRLMAGGGSSVVLRSSPPTTTDANGRFSFKHLAPGAYSLSFSRNGYARQDYGQRTISGAGTPVSLRPAQLKNDIVMRMSAVGAVSGHVRSGSGQELAGVPVQLFRFVYNAAGEKQIQPVAATLSDDRGDFRMFYLSPGRYYLSAGHLAGQTPATGGTNPDRNPFGVTAYSSPNGIRRDYAISYYPGVPNPDLAGIVEVPPGRDVPVDLVLNPQKYYRIRGRVVDSRSSQPPQSVSLSINVKSDLLELSGPLRSPNYKPADGTFDVQDVSPGFYSVTAAVENVSPTPRAAALISVANADIDGVVLTLRAGRTIAGRFRVDSPSPNTVIDFSLLRVELRTPGTTKVITLGEDPEYHPASKDGGFRIDNVVPGEYRVLVRGLPPGFYPKDARLGGIDVLSRRVFVDDSSDALDILLSSNVGAVQGAASPGAQVVLIPGNRDRIDLFRQVVADSEGRFTIPDIAPGEYALAAWEALEPYSYFDPGVIAQSENSGKTIRVDELSTLIVDVTTIPAGN